ncbi:hypothetical protein D3C81_1874030 [compost metagenome]
MPFGELLHTSAQRACTSVIDQLSLSVIGYQYILRLQISEHKTALMQVAEFLQQLQPYQTQPGCAVSGQKMMQRPSLHIPHYVERNTGAVFKVIGFQQIRRQG